MEKQQMTRLRPGEVVTLKVARVNEAGAFLDAGTGNTSDDILLHAVQQIRPVEMGEELPVYLYLDPKKRLTASMRLPKMREGQVARVKVIQTTRDGAFVDVGAERGVFMPFAGMRGKPKVGEKVWVKMYRDKSDRLAVTMEVEDELRRASRPAENVKIGDEITGSVYNAGEQGWFLFTKERYIAFLHRDETVIPPKIGEELMVRITYVREDGRLNVSTRLIKEKAMDQDSEVILKFLRERHGKMPYGDNTTPEVLKEKFGISKSAFKRALGRLMKEGMIRQEEGWTYLMEGAKEQE